MATVINDLVTKFSFQGSPAPLGDYNDALDDSIMLLAGMTAGLFAAAGAFNFWADSTLQGVDALSALSRETGVAVGKLQELNFMASQTQSSQAAVESTVSSLSQTIGQAAQRGNDDFARLGISVRDFEGNVKSADTILFEVGRRFKQLGLTMQEQQSFASSLGIDTSLLRLLNSTAGSMALMSKRARELGTLTAEQTEQAASYTVAVKEMWFGLNAVGQLAAVSVAPEMRRLSSAFTELLIENKAFIVDGIKFTIEWLNNFMAFMNRMAPVFAIATVGFFAMKVATLGWAGALALLSNVPIVLAITAIVLAVDDLITAFRGGESVIADFFQDTFDIDIVKQLSAAFRILGQGLGIIFGQLKAIWGIYSRIANSAIGAISGLFSSDTEGTQADTRAQFAIPTADGASASARVDNRQVNQTNSITVNTNDPEAAARAIDNTLQGQLRDANTQLAPGGV